MGHSVLLSLPTRCGHVPSTRLVQQMHRIVRQLFRSLCPCRGCDGCGFSFFFFFFETPASMVVDFRTLCICPIHSNNAHGLDKTNCCPFSTGQQFRPSTSPIPCLRHSFHPTRPHSPLRSTSNAHVYPNLNCHLLPFPRRPSTSAMQAPTTSTQGSQALGPNQTPRHQADLPLRF